MTEPIAAAPQQEGLLQQAMDTIHDLEQKVEHLIHPDAPEVAQAGEPLAASDSTPGPAVTGDAQSATSESPTSTPSLPTTTIEETLSSDGAITDTTSETFGIVGLVNPGATIRAHLANIKRHLSVRGFELSAIADINAELDAIERLL